MFKNGLREIVKAAQLEHDVRARQRDDQKDHEIADGEAGKQTQPHGPLPLAALSAKFDPGARLSGIEELLLIAIGGRGIFD